MGSLRATIMPVLPQAPTNPAQLVDWAARITSAISQQLRGQGQSGTATFYDTSGRVILTPDGMYAYDAQGGIPISPDLVQINTQHLVDAAISTAKLANLAVDNTKLASLAVQAANLADSAVIATKIANAAVGTAAIAAAAVGTAQIANAAITSALIGNLQVVTAAIADAAVNSAKIANASIGSAHIQNLAVQTAHVQDAAITSAKINSITANQITAGTIGAQQIYLGATTFLLDGGAQKLTISDTQVASIKRIELGYIGTTASDYGLILRDAAGNVFLNSGGVQAVASSAISGNIPNTQITGLGIFATAGQLTAANISTYIAGAAIGTALIANAAITTALIGNAQITTALIADAQITDAKIVSLSASKISATALSAITANLGTVTIDTSGSLKGGQTGYNTGVGFFLGYSGGAYKFSIGNPNGNYLTYDGTTLTVKGQNVLAPYSAGSIAIAASGAAVTAVNTAATWQRVKEIQVARSGTLTASVTASAPSVGSGSFGFVINGGIQPTPTASWTQGAGTSSTQTYNFTVNPGDRIAVYIANTSSSGITISNFELLNSFYINETVLA